MTIRRLNGSTTRPFNFLLIDETDHVSALTGATPSISISKNGGAFAAASGAITELANGWYSWAGNATDRNTNGELVVHVTATGADPFDGKIEIVPWDPFDSAGLGLSNLNATVSSRAAPGDAMTLSANAVSATAIASGAITAAKFAADAIDATALAASAANEIRDAILTDATRFAGANIDAAVSSRATNAGAAAAVWDEARAGHVTAGTFGQGVASVVGSVGSVATGGIVAGSFAADAIDSAALATTAVNEIRDSILSDSTPFQGARIDAAVSSRATNAGAAAAVWDEVRASHVTAGTFGQGVASVQGNVTGSTASIGAGGIAAAAFAASAIDSAALATSAVNEIRDSILSDSTPFQGARIDATISSRASQTSLDPVIAAVIEHTFTVGTGSTTTVVNTDATQATGFFDGMVVVIRHSTGNVARAVTSYNTTNGAFTVSTLPFTPTNGDTFYVLGNVASSATSLTVGAIVNGVWDEARASHTTAGTFGQGAASVQGNVTGSVASVGAGGIAAAAFAANAIDSSALATSAVNEIRDSILSDSTPFQGARIDGTITSRASQTSVDTVSAALVEASLTVGTGSSTTVVNTNATQATGFYDGMIIVFRNAAGNVARAVTSYSTTNGAFTVDALPFTPSNGDSAYVVGNVSAAAGSAPTVSQIVNGVWDEARASHTTAGTFGQGAASVQGNVTGSVASIGAGGIAAATFAANAIDSSALATTAVNEIRDSILSDSTPFQGGRIDAAVSSRATNAAAAAAVWDETRAGHVTAGTFGQGVASVSGAVGSIASGGITATSFAADAIDSAALATTAVNEIRDAIISDATPFQGARIDAAISSRATNAGAATAVWDETRASHVAVGSFGQGVASVQGNVTGSVASVGAGGIAASSFAADAVDSAALATSAVTEIRNAILSDGTAFQGARIDAAISSRATNTGAAAAVWDEPRASHVAAGSFGEGVASVATGGITTGSFAAGAINAAAIGAAALTAAKFATDAIDANALAASAANEVRDTILSDATPFQGARIDATVSSRASQTSVTALSNATIAATLIAAAGSSTTSVRTDAAQATGFFDGMTIVVVNAAGTAARQVTSYSSVNGAFTVAALPFTPAASDAVFVIARPAASGLTAGQVSAAVWDEARASHVTAGTFGEGNNVVSLAADTITASALAASATAEIDTVLTAAHGAGPRQAGGGGGSSTRVQTNVTFDASTNTLRVNAWLEGSGGAITAGTSNGTFRLYDAAGTALTALQTDVAPDANGVFYWTVAAPTFLVGETATYVRASIEYLSVVYEGVTGVTFSRST
mgnify:FL=1